MPSRPDRSSVSHRRSWSLALLCAVQACERFAFLAMLPMFVLYAQERQALPTPTALMVLAVVQALSYLGGLPGGWLADRGLGVRLATTLLECDVVQRFERDDEFSTGFHAAQGPKQRDTNLIEVAESGVGSGENVVRHQLAPPASSLNRAVGRTACAGSNSSPSLLCPGP